MRKYAIFGLASIVLLAILVRLLPLERYFFWGVDTGEYYGITHSLFAGGHLDPVNYKGFGFTYPYFPGIYFVIASSSLVTSLDLLFVFSVVIPVIGALSAFLVFFISREIFTDIRASLVSSLFVAVVVIHYYQTSRTMPATLGHFLLLLCILLLLKAYDSRKYFVLLVPATLALVFTHHLSAYFLLAASVGIFIYREFLKRKSDYISGANTAYVLFLAGTIMLYWFLYVTPFIDFVVAPALKFSPLLLPALLYAGIAILVLMVIARRKAKWAYVPRYRGFRWNAALFLTALALSVSIFLAATFLGLSGAPVDDKTGMLIFLPVVIIVGFVGVGISYADFNRKGFAAYGCLVALGLSFLAVLALNSHEIFPDRHVEILIVVIGLLAGYGFVKFFQLRSDASSFSARFGVIAVLLILFSSMAFTAYPSTQILGGAEQGTYQKDIDGVFWARENVALEPNSVIAAENRLSSDLYGVAGFNATWYSARDTFYAPNFSGARGEMLSCECPSGTKRVDYIFMDDATIKNALLVPWEPHRGITGDALGKFDGFQYAKIFDNGYCRIYMVVNWTAAA